MTHAVKEIFYTLAGRGRQRGPARACSAALLAAILWSGSETGSRHGSSASFCDTDFCRHRSAHAVASSLRR